MKNLFKPWTDAMAVVIAAALLWGCGGAPLMIEPIDPSRDPRDAIEQLGRQIDRARDDQVNVLSPNWFARAEATYTAARRKPGAGGQAKEILKQVAVARAELKRAQVVAIRSRDQLAEAIASRNAARAVHAQRFEREYAAVEDDFVQLTRAVENDEFRYARNHQQRVSQRYRALELQAIALSAVGNVRELLKAARDAKVQEAAPNTFLQAREALDQAEAYIAENRYDRAGIAHKAERARFLVRRCMVIAQTARRIEGMTPEAIALWLETYMFQITSRLQTQDRRDASFEEQQGAILAAVDALRTELTLAQKAVGDKTDLIQKMSDRLAEVEGNAQRIRLDKQRLAADKRFNERLIKVQQYFDPQEADVHIQSGQVLIRLKGLAFPVGEASVPPEGQALLGKVQRAILTFGTPAVIVEGHSDSTGAPQKNLTLSRQRAESVKQFLVDGYGVSSDKISAVGLGSARPVASNDTVEGRARNRRIDVIIKPDKTAVPGR